MTATEVAYYKKSREVQKARAEYMIILEELRKNHNLPAGLQRDLVSEEEEWRFQNRDGLMAWLQEFCMSGEVDQDVGLFLLKRCDVIRHEKLTPNPEGV